MARRPNRRFTRKQPPEGPAAKEPETAVANNGFAGSATSAESLRVGDVALSRKNDTSVSVGTDGIQVETHASTSNPGGDATVEASFGKEPISPPRSRSVQLPMAAPYTFQAPARPARPSVRPDQ